VLEKLAETKVDDIFVKFYRAQAKHSVDLDRIPSFAKKRNKVNVNANVETV